MFSFVSTPIVPPLCFELVSLKVISVAVPSSSPWSMSLLTLGGSKNDPVRPKPYAFELLSMHIQTKTQYSPSIFSKPPSRPT